MKLRAFIVDDERNARMAIRNMLDFYHPDVEVIGEGENVKDSLKQIEKLELDLLFLDIQLPDGTGFDIVKRLKNPSFKIIFVSAYNEYALQAIKLSALDYILKPVKPSDLNIAIEKVKAVIENEERLDIQLDTMISNVSESNQEKKIILNTSENLFVVEVKQIIRCESQENYTTIYMEDRPEILVSKTLKEFEEMLTSFGFFRVHQSHLINLQYVEAFAKKGSGNVQLKSGEQIPVSTRRKEGFLQALEAIL